MLLILKNFSLLTAGKVLGDVFTFVLFVILTRTFGEAGVGQYSIAMAIGGFVLIAADFGLHNLTIKELSRRRDQFAEYFSGIFILRIILSALVFVLLLVLAQSFPLSPQAKQVIVLIGLYHSVYVLINGLLAICVAYEDMYFAGLMEFLLKTTVAVAGIAITLAGGSLVLVAFSMPVIVLAMLLITYRKITLKYGPLRWTISRSDIRASLREAYPFASASLLQLIFRRADVILLGFLIGEIAAGVYNVAYRVALVLTFIPYLMSVAIFPVVSRLHKSSQQELQLFYRRSLALLVLIGLPVSSGLWLIGHDLTVMIYGVDFSQSGKILEYLAWLIILECVINIMGIYLMACDRQKTWNRAWLFAACTGVILNVALISTLGIQGAVYATLISFTLMAAVVLALLRQFLGPTKVLRSLTVGSIGVAAFCVPFSIYSAPIFVVIPASMIIYTFVLLILRPMIPDSAEILAGLFPKRRTG